MISNYNLRYVGLNFKTCLRIQDCPVSRCLVTATAAMGTEGHQVKHLLLYCSQITNHGYIKRSEIFKVLKYFTLN